MDCANSGENTDGKEATSTECKEATSTGWKTVIGPLDHPEKRREFYGHPVASHPGVSNAGRVPGLTKTMLCKFYQDGTCRRGEECSYAHGEHDLRQVPARFHTTKSLNHLR